MKLLKFEKQNCPGCTLVDNYLNEHGIVADKINPFEEPSMAAKFDISSVPTIILLDDHGNEIKRSTGFKPNELEEMIQSLNN